MLIFSSAGILVRFWLRFISFIPLLSIITIRFSLIIRLGFWLCLLLLFCGVLLILWVW